MGKLESLRSFREAKGFTQQQLGKKIAEYLHQTIGESYAQKKTARFEAGDAKPTDKELYAMAHILGVKVEALRSVLATRASYDAGPLVDQLASGTPSGRTMMASCMLGRPRPQTLDESYEAVKSAIEDKNLWIAIFVPYPSAVNLPQPSHHVNNLVGYYTRVINSVLEVNLSLKNSLKQDKADAVALYFPKPDLLKPSAVLIPPIFRQYSLTLQQANPPNGSI